MADILNGLDGLPLSKKVLSQAAVALGASAGTVVTSARVVAGTVNEFPTSHSAVLALTQQQQQEENEGQEPLPPLFIKKVTASAMSHKPWADRQRTLKYARTEARFYKEFATPRLRSRLQAAGASMPRCAGADVRLDTLLGATSEVADPANDEPDEAVLATGGAVLLLECAPPGRLWQASPLDEQQASVALRAVAALHAAAWGADDAGSHADGAAVSAAAAAAVGGTDGGGGASSALLARAASRLQRNAGAFCLSIRNPKELGKLVANWERFMQVFSAALAGSPAAAAAAALFQRPGVSQLGERLERLAHWVASELAAAPSDAYATLMHGDYKAMNVFLPHAQAAGAGGGRDGGGDEAQLPLLIDFASTGVGYGMADVAMHLSHSVAPETLAGGGERRLLESYLQSFRSARRAIKDGERGASGGGDDADEYPLGVALRHYRLGVVDYGRFVVGRFWTAASPEAFAKKAASPNTTLVNRNVDAALAFVERVHEALLELEQEDGAAAVIAALAPAPAE